MMRSIHVLLALTPLAAGQTCLSLACFDGLCPTGHTCAASGGFSTCCPNADLATTCVDKTNPNTGVSDCTRLSYLCSNSAYYSLMTDQCARTCSRCTPVTTTASSTCVDLKNPSTGVSDCGRLSTLCTNSAYYSLMTTQCPRTCGRCSG